MATRQITISVENLAPQNGTLLTPLWFGFHNGMFDTYDRGRPVSPGLESVAEDGATGLISREFDLSKLGKVQGTIAGRDRTPGPVDAGEVATFTVQLDGNDPMSRYFNYAAMIIPSNDFFIANGNERAHEIFDEQGNFLGADFIVTGSNVLDAGSEVNDEVPLNTAFFGQQVPNTGVDENGVVQLAAGFIPGGSILSDPRFANADFKAPGYQVARIRVFAEELTPLEGTGGQNTFAVLQNTTTAIANFGGVGRGISPTSAVREEVDTIQFSGADLNARDLILFQNGDNLEITFENSAGTKVILQDFAIENLDNLPSGIGNIAFNADAGILDSIDVINADANPDQVFNRNTVTFLNGFDNDVRGFDLSDDVINGQRGNDILRGLGGDDLLRGGIGADTLIGGIGNDILSLGLDQDIDIVLYRSGDGRDVVKGFTQGRGGDQLSFEGIDAIDVVANGGSTFFHLSDGIAGNSGFGRGQVLAELQGVTELTADNIGFNLASTNTARFLFA